MAKGGIELATEWVTILPETAELTKRLKNFKPEPIRIPVSIVSGSGTQSPQKQGAAVGKAVDKGVVSATKHTGEKIGQNIAPEQKPVQQAAQKAGKTIQDEVVKGSREAGKKAGAAVAEEIEKQKGRVAAASQKLADARRAEENIGSRIRSSEQKIQQARDNTAKKAEAIANEEQNVARLRAASGEDTANKIAAAERRIQTMRDQQANQLVRLSNMEEAHGRLLNTQATTAGRAQKAANGLAAEEAALASAIAAQNAPMQENADNAKRSGGAFGKMSAALVPLGKQLLVTSGLFTGAMGVGGAISYTFKTGNEFVDTMNRMQGITNANAQEMEALNQKARDLGRDFGLPATSANDAATAMLELTKAGFSVQQAMDAARGSLQLSAAAGVSAAEAAKITGTTLNAFQLDAKESARVTDILANAANIFPGEMQDFAYSLSQGGAVAKSFGINIEDTTTALGLLARAGIKSSDAGTLIKTMLLSLTDQGKPAQAAIHELGLELYDQEGKFRGLEYVYKRLTEASKEMTQEQYQAATQTLFGTDAARFAGLAAGAAAEEWDNFRSRITEVGTAAKVADARMQGLPGAIERMKNAVQSIALTIYDYVKEPVTAVVNAIAAMILKFDDWLNGPIKEWLGNHKEELMGIATVLGTYVGVITAIKVATAAWSAVQWVLNAALTANPVGVAIAAIAALVAGVIYAYKHFDWFKNAVDGVWNWIKSVWPTVLGVFKAVWDGIATGIKWLARNVWGPEWRFIKGAWEVVWFALKVGFKLFKLGLSAIGDTAVMLWQNYMKPAFHGIAAAGKFMWDLLKAAWEGIKMSISAVWDWLQPVIQPMKDFFQSVGDVGKAAGEAIKSAWSGLWEVLKLPLHGLGSLLAGIPESVLGIEVPFVADLHNWGKSLQALKTGGVIKGPGTGTSDSILGINASGIPVARVSNGEGVVPADALTTPLGKMLFGALLNLPGLATGGVIGQFMAQVTGTPYAMGGFGPNGFDCSGLVSAMVNVAMGRKWNQGPPGGSARTSTAGEADWLLSQGFVAGMGGPGLFRVSFKNGGPGGGHTAGTLPDGTNFESTTPGGVRFGSGAAGAGDSQFDQHFFLPRGPQLGMRGQPGSIGANFMGAGSGAFGPSGIYGGGAGNATDNKRVREAQDRLEDRTRQLEVAKKRLEEYLEKQRAGKNVKGSTIDAARNQVEKFTRERDEAEADLATAQQNAISGRGSSKRGSGGSSSGTGQQDWSDVGKMIFSGFLESFGLDGSVFTNLFQTPNFKSAMAGVNFMGGLLGAVFGGGDDGSGGWTGGGGSDTSGGLGNLLGGMSDVGGGLIAGVGDIIGVDLASNGGAGDSMGGTVGNGPQINQDFSGSQFGYSKDEFNQYRDGKQQSIARRYPNLAAGGA